jgi:hypothetical protein
LWRQRLAGLPVHTLTALGRQIYVTLQLPDRRHEILVIEDLSHRRTLSSRSLWTGSRPSWTAADEGRREGVFLSQDGENLQLHRILRDGTHARLLTRSVIGPPPPLASHVPIAFLGGMVFAVFAEEERLCRIDAEQAELEGELGAGAPRFSLSETADQGWDGDGVLVSNQGVHFLRANLKDSFLPQERAKASPVLIRGRNALLAMLDGRLRAYDLLHLPRYDAIRLTAPGEEITTLIAFQSYVAAGTRRGAVKLLALRERPASS